MLRTLARPHLNVDLAVEMPPSCFLEKDIRDHKYHIKRALYLEHLAKKLHGMKGVTKVDIKNLHGDARKPYLELHQGRHSQPPHPTTQVDRYVDMAARRAL
eukprot:5463022-Pyramimonas_sp.AAC.1